MDLHNMIESVSQSAALYPFSTFTQKGKIYTCVNSYAYHLIRQNPRLYSQMDGLFVDGMLLCVAINSLWGRKIPRLSFDMTGMAKELFSYLENNTQTIYFIGAKPDEVEKSVKTIRDQYPKMNIMGFRHGYFNDSDERNDTIQNLVKRNPDFVIIGMGSPMQEQFSIDLKKAGYQGIAFTCGGFLHQTQESINYYPSWINKWNLRAFYRLYKEKGLIGRLYNVLIEFPILFIKDTVSSKFSSTKIL